MWWFSQNNKKFGPFQEKDFKELARNGIILPDTKVWKNGFSNWVLAKNVSFSSLSNQKLEFLPFPVKADEGTTPPPRPKELRESTDTGLREELPNQQTRALDEEERLDEARLSPNDFYASPAFPCTPFSPYANASRTSNSVSKEFRMHFEAFRKHEQSQILYYSKNISLSFLVMLFLLSFWWIVSTANTNFSSEFTLTANFLLTASFFSILMLCEWNFCCLTFHLWRIVPAFLAYTKPVSAVIWLFVPFFNFFWMFVMLFKLIFQLNYLERYCLLPIQKILPAGLLFLLGNLLLPCIWLWAPGKNAFLWFELGLLALTALFVLLTFQFRNSAVKLLSTLTAEDYDFRIFMHRAGILPFAFASSGESNLSTAGTFSTFSSNAEMLSSTGPVFEETAVQNSASCTPNVKLAEK